MQLKNEATNVLPEDKRTLKGIVETIEAAPIKRGYISMDVLAIALKEIEERLSKLEK